MLQKHALRAHIQIFFFHCLSAHVYDVFNRWIGNWLMTSLESLWRRTFTYMKSTRACKGFSLERDEGGTLGCMFSVTTGPQMLIVSIRLLEVLSARSIHLPTSQRNRFWYASIYHTLGSFTPEVVRTFLGYFGEKIDNAIDNTPASKRHDSRCCIQRARDVGFVHTIPILLYHNDWACWHIEASLWSVTQTD